MGAREGKSYSVEKTPWHYSDRGDAFLTVCRCVCVCVAVHRGKCDTVSLPGWRAAVSLSSEWKPIWQITSSRHSAHPPLSGPAVIALSRSHFFFFYFSPLLVLLCVTPTRPPTVFLPLSSHLGHSWPGCTLFFLFVHKLIKTHART